MTTVKEIEKAIVELPPKKFSILISLLDKLEAARWDKRFEGDVKSGKLNAMAAKARANFKKGKCKEL